MTASEKQMSGAPLKRCPLCSSPAYKDAETAAVFGARTGDKFAIACSACETSAPGANDIEKARENWNMRPPMHDAAQDMAEALKAFVSHYPSGINPDLDAAWNAARAALSKANGAA